MAAAGTSSYLLKAEGWGWGKGTLVETACNWKFPLYCKKNSLERKWKTVPDGQWKIFVGWKCYLLVKNNYALKIRVQTYQPTKKRRRHEGKWPGYRWTSLVLFSSPVKLFTFHLCVYLRHRHWLGVYSGTVSHLYVLLKIFQTQK